MKIKQPNDLLKTLLQQENMIIWRDWKKKNFISELRKKQENFTKK